ncbi:MAG: alcohol dehydrogenase catalytic domain-containing protein, partial [Nakamurella sp.]
MKALVVHGAGDLRIDETDIGEPGEGQVLVRMTHGGICGSDLHYYRHGAVGAFTLREPLVLGHEVVGVVDLDPSGSLAAGTPVAIHPATPCTRCPECLAGYRNVCRHARYFGSAASMPHTQGGFSEFMVVRDDQLRRLPEGLPLSRAVLAEPLAVGMHALRRAGGVAGAKVLIKAGAIDYLAKPFAPEELLHAVARCAERYQLVRENATLRARVVAPYQLDQIIGESPKIL